MSLFKQPGSRYWWFSVYRPGQPRLRGSTGTEDEATAKAVEATVRMAQGKKTPADRLHRMIDELVGCRDDIGLPIAGIWTEYEAWITSNGARLSFHTLRGRQSAVRRFVAWANEYWPAAALMEKVDRACAAAYAKHLASSGAKSKTRANVLSDLRTVWSALQRIRDGITANPWGLVIPEVRDSERGQAFTRENEMAIMRAADQLGHGWGLACRIARHTGLRYGDIATLTWGCVDLDAGWIALNPSKTERHGISVRVPLSSSLRAALAAARPSCAVTDEHVLPAEHWRGYPNSQVKFLFPFRNVLNAAKVGTGYTFHSWRHTFRTRLSEAGVSDEISKRLGGWTKDATAMHYDHDGRAKELVAAVEKAALQT
jgi:integrase